MFILIFSLKNLGKKVSIIHGKIGYFQGSLDFVFSAVIGLLGYTCVVA